jgi:hypothetical protein
VAGCCVRGNEPSGTIKFREFLDYRGNVQRLKKDSDPYSYLVGAHFVAKRLLGSVSKIFVVQTLTRGR